MQARHHPIVLTRLVMESARTLSPGSLAALAGSIDPASSENTKAGRLLRHLRGHAVELLELGYSLVLPNTRGPLRHRIILGPAHLVKLLQYASKVHWTLAEEMPRGALCPGPEAIITGET